MPVFVVSLDGPDLVGKTTIAALMTYVLRKKNKGRKIIFRRTELPSNLITGSFVDILRNSADKASQEVFSLAYSLDHLNHYEKFIKPVLEKRENCVIVQERSLLTLFVYQGLIGKVDLKWLRELNRFNNNIPNLTLILRIDTQRLLNRKKLIVRGFDEFEVKEHLEKQLKIYYNLPKELVKEFNVEYVDVDDDAMVTAERCAERIQKEIDERF